MDTFATERLFEVEDCRLQSPEPYQFELLAHQAAVSVDCRVDRCSYRNSKKRWFVTKTVFSFHFPPSQPIAKFDCNSWVSAHRWHSLLHFYNKICPLTNSQKCQEVDQNQSIIQHHTQKKPIWWLFWWPSTSKEAGSYVISSIKVVQVNVSKPPRFFPCSLQLYNTVHQDTDKSCPHYYFSVKICVLKKSKM